MIRKLITVIILISSILLSFTQCKNNEIKLKKVKNQKVWFG